MAEFVTMSVENKVATITLARPPMNALNRQMQDEIGAFAREASTRADVGAVLLFGGEKLFAAGADVKEMAAMDYQDMVQVSADLHRAFNAVAEIPKPTIAAITGFALGGGCELAMCCDMRIAADNAKLGQPEILLGIIPGAGGTQRLSRLVGPSRAKDLVFTGRFIDAAEALIIGLVDRVVPADHVFSEAMALAQRLAQGPAIAMRLAKESIDKGLEVDLRTGLDIERAAFAACFATDDQSIGMSSFIENGPGKAEFTGR